jgi:beta-glucanase (GH16 family)
VRVNDWGNSGGLWRLPVIITTDKTETDLFKPLSDIPFDPEKEGYELFWEDEFNGIQLDSTKWAVRGVGPRGVGFITPDALEIKDGKLNINAFMENDSLKISAVGTQRRFETTFGYFECRAQLPKTTGNWAAFWIQSPGISSGEDPAKFGVEIDIFEYFKSQGGDFVSHNLHWAYGPNQKSTGAFLSKVEGIGEGYHTFALEWTPEKYAFFVDGYKYYEIKEAISHIDEYIILSFEPAHSLEDLKKATLPDSYSIDYVKVYKKNN